METKTQERSETPEFNQNPKVENISVRTEIPQTKVCVECKKRLPIDQFELWGAKCRSCTRKYQKEAIKKVHQRRRNGDASDLRRKLVVELTGVMKTCTGECKETKDEAYFELRADSHKRRSQCKECRKAYVRKYRRDRWNNRREKISPNLAVDGQKTCGNCNNVQDMSEFQVRTDSKDGLRNHCRTCRQKNYIKWILSTNDRKIAHHVRQQISFELLDLRQRAPSSDSKIGLMKMWLEFQFDDKMNWTNWGSYWHIDHILPMCKFRLGEEQEKAICLNWKNLQPLRKRENLKKGGKIIPHYFWNSVVNLVRFIRKYNLPADEYQSIRESICWLREKTSDTVTSS